MEEGFCEIPMLAFSKIGETCKNIEILELESDLNYSEEKGKNSPSHHSTFNHAAN